MIVIYLTLYYQLFILLIYIAEKYPLFLPGQKFGSRFLFHLRPLANSATMSTLSVHCQWGDETARERTGHPPSYAEAKKMKSLTLHTHGCLRASLRNCSCSHLLYVS